VGKEETTMSRDPIADYIREREERLKSIAPQRSHFGAPDIFGGQKEAENAAREREAKAEQYRSFYFRKHGRHPSETEVREYLGETSR
jgi:hypothetical protein